MSSGNGGLVEKVIDAATGHLVSDLIEGVERRISTSAPVRSLRERFQRDLMHTEAKRLFSESLSIVSAKLSREGKKNLKIWLDNQFIRSRITLWVLSDPPDVSEGELSAELKGHFPEDDAVQLAFFLNLLFQTIRERKRTIFSPECLNILSRIDQMDARLAKSLPQIEEINANVRLLCERQGLSLSDSTSAVEGLSLSPEIGRIKDMINAGKVVTARNEAARLLAKTAQNPPAENESQRLLNAYIAECHLRSAVNQTEAIPFLLAAANLSTEDEHRHMYRALALWFQGERKEALKQIEAACLLRKEKPRSVLIRGEMLIEGGALAEARKFITKEIPTPGLDEYLLLSRIDSADERHFSAMKNALRAKQRDPNNPWPLIRVADALFASIGARISQGSPLLPSQTSALIKVREYLDVALENLDREQTAIVADVHAKRGVVYAYLGEPTKALRDFRQAEDHYPGNPTIRNNLALSLMECEEYSEAVDILIDLKQAGPDDPSVDVTLSQAYIMAGSPEKAVSLLESATKKEGGKSPDHRLHSLLVEAYDRNLETSKAEEALAALESNFGGKPITSIARARHFHRIGRIDEAIALLEESKPEEVTREENTIRQTLALLLFERGHQEDWRRAADLYGDFVNTDILDEPLRRYSISLFRAGLLTECVDLCEEVCGKHGHVDPFSEILAAIYFNSDNFLRAANLFKVLFARNPSHLEFAIHHAQCLYRLGRFQEAVDALRQAEKSMGDTPRAVAFAASCFASFGAFDDAIRLAIRAVDNDPQSPEMKGLFVSILHRAENFNYEAAPEIINRYQQYVKDVAVKQIQLSKKPEEFIEKLRHILEEEQQDQVSIEKNYHDYRLPLSNLSSAARKNLISVWSDFTEQPYCKVWVASGEGEEFAREVECATNARSIVVGPVAILTAHRLGLIKNLAGFYDRIYMPQATLDLVHERLFELESSLKYGTMTIWAQEGQVYKDQMSAELVQSKVKDLRALLTILGRDGNTRLIGKSLDRKVSGKTGDPARLSQCLGIPTVEAVLESRARGAAMYCEEWFVRRLAESEFGVKSFGTRSLIQVLQDKAAIDEERFHSWILDLLSLNYHFVAITPGTLRFAVEESGFQRSDRALSPFESLKHPDNDMPGLFRVALPFLSWLWKEVDMAEVRRQWTDVTLNSLTFRRNKGAICETIRSRSQGLIHPLMVCRAVEFDESLNTWLQGQPII